MVPAPLRPAVQAVPRAITARLGSWHVTLVEDLGGGEIASQWTAAPGGLEITVATRDVSPHDVALELLVCLGQALWEKSLPAEREAYWKMLAAEMEAGVAGEIDERALREKQALLAGRLSARSRRRLERYAQASFAGTVAEYIHCLWHDVKIRRGPRHLPARWLRRRLETIVRWFPPNRGYRLFARPPVRKSSG